MKEAQRLLKLPTYVFALLDKLKAEARAKGKDLIDLTIGSPNHLPPKEVIDAFIAALNEPHNHRYSSFEGDPAFKQATLGWCKRQYNLHLEENEVVQLLGSKEGLVHFAFAYLDPNDKVLVPLPAYPAHFRGPLLAGADVIVMPTTEHNGWLPDLDAIEASIAKQAKMMILSYPTNPTAAAAPFEFFERAVRFAKKHDLILIHDLAYGELYFDGKKPLSCLAVRGAKEVCIEFHTLSKTFGMAGWRCGFAVGNAQLIESLRKIKTNLDYGPFPAITKASTVALQMHNGYMDNVRQTYQRRRDIMVEGLTSLGWKLKKPSATFYLWVPTPAGFTALSFTQHLVQQAGVVVSPGTGFGELGEGYVRFALVDTDDRLKEAIDRLRKAEITYA